MARPKADVPAYTRHSNGRAKVIINSKNHYLGKYGSPESFAKYMLFSQPTLLGLSAKNQSTKGEEPKIADLTNSHRCRELPEKIKSS